MDMTGQNGNLGEDFMELFIFRTNISRKADYLRVKSSLLSRQGVHGCTIDLEDCDKVLRVECENIPVQFVVEEVVKHGFFCEELAD